VKLWDDFVAAQEKTLGKEAVERWLKSLKVVHFDAQNLYLEAKDPFQANWFEEQVRSKVRTGFRNNNGRPVKVHVSISGPQKAVRPKTGWMPVFNPVPDALDPIALFENFVPGKKNAADFSLLQEALEKKLYNPIYLFGPKGSGKSHLLMACCHFLAQKNLRCRFVRAQTFTEHVVAAIRTANMQALRDAYRSCDVLAIDDIHEIGGRAATQEELFHTFNALHSAGKQILLSSSKPPRLLSDIEPRLTSRFEWGIVLSVRPVEERTEILALRSRLLAFPLSNSAADFLLAQFQSHPQALVKAFDALVLRSHLERLAPEQIDEAAAARILRSLLEEEKKSRLDPDKIIRSVAAVYGLTPEDILGKSQAQECSVPRQIAMYFCRKSLKMPFMKIGEIFSRDHSTVMTSVKTIEKRREEFSSRLQEIAAKLDF